MGFTNIRGGFEKYLHPVEVIFNYSEITAFITSSFPFCGAKCDKI